MLHRTLDGEARVEIDERELRRVGRSFMIDTLASVRNEIGPLEPLVFALGMDAFLTLTRRKPDRFGRTDLCMAIADDFWPAGHDAALHETEPAKGRAADLRRKIADRAGAAADLDRGTARAASEWAGRRVALSPHRRPSRQRGRQRHR